MQQERTLFAIKSERVLVKPKITHLATFVNFLWLCNDGVGCEDYSRRRRITITLRQETRSMFCGVVSGFGILLFIAKSFELQSRGEEEVGK